MVLFLLAGYPSSATDKGMSAREKPLFTKHFQNSLFDVTEHAVYSMEILLDDQEYKIGKNVIGIVIHNARDEDVPGAQVTFLFKDLIADKNSLVTPIVTDKGNGLYIVSGLDLQKEGKWELTITVKKDRIEDIVKFVLPDALKSRVPKGRYSP
jgi:hypothetical protein